MSLVRSLLLGSIPQHTSRSFHFASFSPPPSRFSQPICLHHIFLNPFAVQLRSLSTRTNQSKNQSPSSEKLSKNSFKDQNQDDEVQLHRQTEFPGPKEYRDYMQSEENKQFRSELGKILKQSQRQRTTLTFGVLNSRLAKLYPKKVKKWIEYAKTPQGFYDTAGEWTAGRLDDNSRRGVDPLADEEKIMEESISKLGAMPSVLERAQGRVAPEDLEELDQLLSKIDLPSMSELDPDFVQVTEEEQPASIFESKNLQKALEALWTEDSTLAPTVTDPFQNKTRILDDETIELFGLGLKRFNSDDTGSKELRDTIQSFAEDPEKMENVGPGKFPPELEKFKPNPQLDSPGELEAKAMSLADYDSRYNWHYKRAELLREKIRLKDQFQLPLPDDLQGGYRFHVSQQELDEYRVPPKLREFLSIRYGTGREKRQYRIRRYFEKYRRHFADTGSPELSIFALTVRIVALRQTLLLTPRDTTNARGLEILIHRRRALLKYLKRTDPKAYFKVLNAIPLPDTVGWRASPRSTL